jgi:hypothetical protein
MLTPFAYPSEPHQRKHGLAGYSNYQEYKDWLRDEFTFRCIYCLEREMWYPSRAAAFSVDHVIPQCEDAALGCHYDNLVYACLRCNSAKQDLRLLDPSTTAFGMHLRIENDGSITALTTEGKDLIEILHLDKDPAMKVRAKYLRQVQLKLDHPQDANIDQDYREAFGYPEELPNLARQRPPGGNHRQTGIETCYYKLRLEGKLAEVY